MTGVPLSGSGHSPKGGAAKASPAKPSVPNASAMYAGFVGRCSVPMWSGMGAPAGFCERPAYGQQYSKDFLPPKYWPPNHAPYAPRYCCDQHGGPGEKDIRFMRDGDMWMAFEPTFENVAESIAGFGTTQLGALADLRAQLASAGEAGTVTDSEAGVACEHATGKAGDAQDKPGSRKAGAR